MQEPNVSPASSPTTSTGRTARELVARGAFLLDVRTPDEFRAGHVPGAVNIPLPELLARAGEIDAGERPVVVYCRSGRRSAEATTLLRQRGLRQVHDMGAMLEWLREV